MIEDWQDKGLDAVLCPAMPVPAMPLGTCSLAKSIPIHKTLGHIISYKPYKNMLAKSIPI